MNNLYLYMMIPFISAAIGWLTNYIAVKMIFRPRSEVRILGLRIMGLIPKRKADLADKIADTVERELISHKDIRALTQNSDFHDRTGALIKTKIDEFVEAKVASNPLLSMFLTPDMTDKFTVVLMDELQKNIPHMIDHIYDTFEEKIDFRKIISEKINNFELERLEKIVYDISARELKSIEVLGGILGFFVGLVQLGILLFGANNV
ncbi:MAG: DUF445 domain-containing protein [Chitinispirillaceae bacterium]